MALHVALIEPRIPPNTGNIARLCAGAKAPLHLIEPLGFELDEKAVRRAGLDHWDAVELWVHPDWFAFRDAISRGRCLYFSPDAERDYTEAPYRWNSVLVFGSETEGLPPRIREKHPDRCFRIPMPGDVRSLNLANAVSVVLYEGMRQLGVTHAAPAGTAGPAEPAEEPAPAAPSPRGGRGRRGRGRRGGA